ncbi:MAG: hypothetical protein ACKVOI_07175 [Dongiaceae bacterium]
MKSRFVVTVSSLAIAAVASIASLQIAAPVRADSTTMKAGSTAAQPHRTNSAVLGTLSRIPLQCSVGGGGDVAATVRVVNQTPGVIPAGKLVSWTVIKEGTTAKQNGSMKLTTSLQPNQSAFVGSTIILSQQVCTASVAL